jgi:hypothetical protein
MRERVDPKVQLILWTHKSELRFHLFGEKYIAAPVALTISPGWKPWIAGLRQT